MIGCGRLSLFLTLFLNHLKIVSERKREGGFAMTLCGTLYKSQFFSEPEALLSLPVLRLWEQSFQQFVSRLLKPCKVARLKAEAVDRTLQSRLLREEGPLQPHPQTIIYLFTFD